MKSLSKKILSGGVNLDPVAGDISSPIDGDIWYNSSLGKFRKKENGSVSNLDTTGGGGGGITYSEITGTSFGLAANNGYLTNNASLVTGTLPVSSAVGDVFEIIGKGAGGWRLSQNASQLIRFNDLTSIAGTSGYVISNNRYDSIKLMCIVADTEFEIINCVGNISINI